MSRRRLGNLFKRRFLVKLPSLKTGFVKSGFSRWAGKQLASVSKLGQAVVTDYLA